MFGLMKARMCTATAEARLRRRLNYCGTCKTIGQVYGHGARVFLNHDTVFLAELLTALSGQDRDLAAWAPQYQSYNCLTLPRAPADMPLALQVAAAATMVMAEFKIADHMADREGRGWKLARVAFAEKFRRAESALKGWAFPIDQLRECWEAQIAIERSPAPPEFGWDELLLHYSCPTARATALFFEHGARIACNGRAADELRALGQSFGTLVYLLDALEDYRKDARARAFNPLRLAFRATESTLDPADRHRTVGLLRRIGQEVESGLASLPIPFEQSRQFQARLRANLSSRIGARLPVVDGHAARCAHHFPDLSLHERLRQALSMGRTLTRRHLDEECQSLAARIVAPFVFAYTAGLALAFPDQMQTVRSARQSFGMPFNLILVGGLIRSWPRIILKPIPPSGPAVGGGLEEPATADAADQARAHAEMAAEASKKRGGRGGCCDSGCCCDCGDCDCCCDCGDCDC